MAYRPERRGPKLGDTASLWNFTPSPGWSKDEANILKLCLMKFGVGKWVQILDTGLLPGKMIQQLNGQTQRLIGQQSLAAYTGLKVDIDRIRADNQARKEGVERKGGLIIWSGPNPTKQMKAQWQKDAKAKYELSEPQLLEVEEQLEDIAAKLHRDAAPAAGNRKKKEPKKPTTLDELMRVDFTSLTREQRLQLLRRIRRRVQKLDQQLSLAHGCQPCKPEEHGSLEPGAAPAAAPAARNPSCSNENSAMANAAQPTAAAAAEAGGAAAAAPLSASNRLPAKQAAGAAKPAAAKKAVKAAPKSKAAAAAGPRKRKAAPAAAAAAGDVTGAGREALPMEVDEAEAATAAADASDIAQLQGMGFSKARAKDALEETSGNLEAAIEWLVTNCI